MVKSYFYYSKNDPSKDPIDKVLTFDEKKALYYFSSRKKMNEETFLTLYNIEIYEKPK